MLGTKFKKPLQPSFVQKIEYIESKNEKGEIVKIPSPKTVANDAPNTLAKYSEMIRWCNANNARMVDRGEYYEVIAHPKPTDEELIKRALTKAKYERAAKVEALTVEVDGMVFDADETSQARMSVAASSMTDDELNVWVLYDNSVVQVTKDQLLQACRLARIAQSAIWTKPYES